MEKLNCDIVRDLLPSYEDELLHKSVRAAVAEHLSGCPACAETLTARKWQEQRAQQEIAERDWRFRTAVIGRRAWWSGFLQGFFISLVLALLAVWLLLLI